MLLHRQLMRFIFNPRESQTMSHVKQTHFFLCMILISIFFSLAISHEALAETSADANAQKCNPELVKLVGKFLKVSHFTFPEQGKYPSVQNGARLIVGICRPWPEDASKTISAFLYIAGKEGQATLFIVLIDGERKQVLASYQDNIGGDAATDVEQASLRLDLARYRLAPNTRAFAVRINAFHDRCGFEGGYDDELTLFVVEKRAIRPVLQTTMHRWQYQGDRCGGEDAPRADVGLTIAVEPTSTTGFADLKFTARLDDEVSSATAKPVSAIVKYDGKRYNTDVLQSLDEALLLSGLKRN